MVCGGVYLLKVGGQYQHQSNTVVSEKKEKNRERSHGQEGVGKGWGL